MKLADLNIRKYNELLASSEPAPGGGAASALAGAQGIALSLMVINLTIGKEKYKEFEPLCLDVKIKAEKLLEDLILGIDKDKDAFNLLSSAYKMPKDTIKEKVLRSNAIIKTTIGATEVPLEAMQQGLEGLKLTYKLIGKSNKSAVSDLGVAALNLLSCVKGAWLNVLINIPSIKDLNMAEDFKKRGQAIYTESEKLCEEIYNKVASSF
ncbi:cyclodeaminase/cyclohydrolase family protein [Anaerovorax odorimutans]|uniref:cyclodeaminase/cyclohydrolase family protein n=1 Tax=Anaerovorax odorimutans TaxID=109327 RepID=UPI00041F1BCE|nr:cyclodeaminase/cyclohydrolase family protein [Anaerovorax odorimutans]